MREITASKVVINKRANNLFAASGCKIVLTRKVNVISVLIMNRRIVSTQERGGLFPARKDFLVNREQFQSKEMALELYLKEPTGIERKDKKGS